MGFFISGLIAPYIVNLTGALAFDDSNYQKIIEETIKWADFKYGGKKEPLQKTVACISLDNGQLKRELYLKTEEKIEIIASEVIGYDVDKLDLPESRIRELKEQKYIVVKVYE